MLTQLQWPQWWYRFNVCLAANPTGARLHTGTLLLLDQFVAWASRHGYVISRAHSDYTLIWLTTRDQRNGLLCTAPVMSIADGDDLILLATNPGQAHHPAWYHNLRAHREASVQQQGEIHTYWAREVGGEERRRALKHAIAACPRFADNTRLIEGRATPILILTPAFIQEGVAEQNYL